MHGVERDDMPCNIESFLAVSAPPVSRWTFHHHDMRQRCMRLQIPVGFVIGLPDAAEVGLAADAGGARDLRLTRRPCDGHKNDGGDNGLRQW
jgi:hypothetical protein